MKVSLNLRRKLIPFGYACDYQLETALKAFDLPLLVDRCLSDLLPIFVRADGNMLDVKGRDPQLVLSTHTPPELLPLGEELVFVSGVAFLNEDELKSGSYVVGSTGRSFELRLSSAFKEFSGSHHITHSSALRREGALPGFVELGEIARVFPLELEHFRLGFDLFQSRFVSNMLGFAPAVSQTVLIDADRQNLRIRILAEALVKRSSLPLERDNLLGRLSAVTSAVIGFDLACDYALKTGDL